MFLGSSATITQTCTVMVVGPATGSPAGTALGPHGTKAIGQARIQSIGEPLSALAHRPAIIFVCVCFLPPDVLVCPQLPTGNPLPLLPTASK